MRDKFWQEPSNWLIALVIACYGAVFIVWGVEKVGLMAKETVEFLSLVLFVIPVLAAPFVFIEMNRRHRIELAKISARAEHRS